MPATALEICGKRERREDGWFAAYREVLMELVAKRNEAAASARRRQGQAAAAQAAVQLKVARKALKRAVDKAKKDHIIAMIDSCSGGQKVFWETVRAVNGGDSRATTVALQTFLGDAFECATPKANERKRGGEAFHEGLQRHAGAPAGRSGGHRLGQAEADEV